MSGYYAASQFDHAFKPIKLLNYQISTNPWPGKYAICSPLKCCTTEFIACDNGHMYPCIARNCCTSPWGDYQTSIWEQTESCCCIPMLRHPENFKPQKLIYIGNEVNQPLEFSKDTASEFNNPETKEGMMDDVLNGRDPCCPGQKKYPPDKSVLGKTMMGDSKSIQRALRKQRMLEKRALMNGRGRKKGPTPYPQAINLRFSLGCGDAAKRACSKAK